MKGCWKAEKDQRDVAEILQASVGDYPKPEDLNPKRTSREVYQA